MILIRCATRRYTAFNDFGNPQVTTLFETPTRITIGNESSYGASLSPNGAYMFYTSDKSGNKDIYVKKTRGGFPQQLTSHPADDFFPVMSPNGKRVAFVSRRANASGAIHIMEIGQTFSKLSGNIEGSVIDVNLRDAENRNPAWFPKGDKIVFSARVPGESTPMLCLSTTDDDPKITRLEDIRGDYPTVSHDGTKLAYSRYGSIFIYDLQTKQETKLTDGNIVQDGHPRFTDNDEEITYIRYADDTNDDGLTNALDRPSIWKLNIAYQVANQGVLDNFHITPLTSANYSAFYPSLYAPYLYFSTQDLDSLDIYRLPSTGHVKTHKTLEATIENFELLSDDNEKTFVLRNATANFFRSNNLLIAGKLALEELEWLYELNRFLEGDLLAKKIEKNFHSDRLLLSLVKLAAIQGKLTPYRYPDGDKEVTSLVKKEILIWQAEIRDVKNNSNGSDELSEQSKLTIKYLEAQIDATLGNAKAAIVTLEDIAAMANANSSMGSKALYYKSKIEFASESPEAGIQTIVKMIQTYPNELTRAISGSLDIVTMTSLTDPNAVEKLESVKKIAEKTPTLKAYCYRRLAAAYRQQRKYEAANNELKAIIKEGIGTKTVVLDATSQLIQEEEGRARFASIGGIFSSIRENYSGNYEILTEIDQMESDYHVRRGRANLANGDFGFAIKEFEEALKTNSKNVSANQGIIDAKALRSDLLSSIKEYRAKSKANSNDSDAQYLLAYALNKSPTETESERIKVIDESIQMLEGARNLNGQIAQYHTLLGTLYLEKAQIRKRHKLADTYKSKLSRSFEQLKGFFGFREANWFELSIDSNLSAFTLAPPNTVEQSDLAQILGDTYFENQNYQLSLRFYTKRIQTISSIPVGSVRSEMLLFRHAGRAAFFAQELDVAFAYQARAYQLAKEINRDIDIAYSLDVLALTLREQKKFAESKDVLSQLLTVNTTMNDRANQANTRVNLAYSYYMSDKYKLALEQYTKARDLLNQHSDSDQENESDSIRIDLGGQNTASKGFSKLEKLIQISAFRAQVYLGDDNYEEALKELKDKTKLLETKHQQGKKLGFAATYLAEDFAITHNNIAFIQCKKGNMTECISEFKTALDYAKRLRIKDQKYPARPEWLNLLDLSRAHLLRADMNQISEKEKGDILASIDEALKQFEEPVKLENREAMLASAALKSVSAQLMTIGVPQDSKIYLDAQQRFQDSILLSEKLGIRSVFTNTANLNLDRNLSEDRENREDIFASQVSFRKNAITNPTLAWKYLASRGMCQQALAKTTAFIASGGQLNDSDRALIKRCVESELNSMQTQLSNERDPEQALNSSAKTFEVLRQYNYILFHSHKSLKSTKPTAQIPETSKEVQTQEGIQELFPIGRNERVTAALEKHDGFASIFRHENGDYSTFLATPGYFKYFRFNHDKKEFDLEQAFESLNSPNKLERVYVFTDHLESTLTWPAIKKLQQKLIVSFLPAPDMLPKLASEKCLGKEAITMSHDQAITFAWDGYIEKLSKIQCGSFALTKLKLDHDFSESHPILHEEFPLTAIRQLDKDAVLIGYLGHSSNEITQRGQQISSRSLDLAEESFKAAQFEKAQQFAKESYVISHQLKNSLESMRAANIVVETMLKGAPPFGMSYFREQYKRLSSKQNKTRSIDDELNGVAFAMTKGDILSAKKLFDDVAVDAKKTKDKSLLARLQRIKADINFAFGEYILAEDDYALAKDLFLQVNDPSKASSAALRASLCASKKSESSESSLKWATLAADLAARAHDRKLFLEARKSQLEILFAQEKFSQGLKLSEEILAEAKQILPAIDLLEFLLVYGRLLIMNSQYQPATEVVAKARTILGDLKDKEPKEKFGLKFHSLQATNLAVQGKKTDSQRLFNSFLAEAPNSNHFNELRDIHHEFALWLVTWGEYKSANQEFKKSIHAATALGSNQDQFLYEEHANLAFTFLQLNQLNEALEAISAVDKIAKNSKTKIAIARVELIRADIAINQKNWEVAQNLLQNSADEPSKGQTPTYNSIDRWKYSFGLAQVAHLSRKTDEALKQISIALDEFAKGRREPLSSHHQGNSITHATPHSLNSLAIQIFILNGKYESAWKIAAESHFSKFNGMFSSSNKPTPLATLRELQDQLLVDSQFVEYFWGVDGLTTFLISKDKIQGKFFPVSQDKSRQFKTTTNKAGSESGNTEKDLADLVFGAFEESFKNAKELVLVTDGPLDDLNILAMLQQRHPKNQTPVLSYVPYAMSPKPEANGQRNSSREEFSSVALIIPDHPSHFSYKEKAIIPRFFPNSSVLEDNQSTFDHWKTASVGKDILHLSLPAYTNKQVATEINIDFPALKGTRQRINVSDIAKLNLNNRLTLLSHAQSPVWLANAFLAARSHNVIINTGETDDVTSSFLIKNFYKHILSGDNPCRALWNAQQKAKKYFPKNQSWTNYRIYGECAH